MEGVLGAKVTRVGCFDLATGFVVMFLFLEGLHLRLGQNAALRSDLGLQSLQAVLDPSRDIALQCPVGRWLARSWRNQIDRTPDGETNTPSLRSSLEVRV